MKLKWLAAAAAVSLLSGCGGGAPERKEQYIQRGERYLETHDYEKARVEFQNALQVDPKDADAHYNLGRTIQKLGDPVAAVGQFQSSLDINPDHVRARAALARLYAIAGLPELADKAMVLIDKGLQQNANDAGLLTARAAVALQRGDLNGAIADAERSYSLQPDDGETIGLLASMYAQNQQPDRAIGLVSEALKRTPDDVEMNIVIADLYQRTRQYPEAEIALRKVVEIEPANLTRRARLARFYLDRENVDAAEKVLRDGIKVSPKDTQAKAALLVLLRTQRPPEVLESAIREFLAADGENAELRLSLGDFYAQSGQLDRAAEEYQSVVQREKKGPEGLLARNKLASLAVQRNDVPHAKELIAEILAENPRDNGALTLRGMLAISAGQYDAAIADLRSVLLDQPDSVAALRGLSKAQGQSGDVSLAEETLRNALQLNPADPGLRFDLAMLLAGTGRNSQALPMFEALVKQAPTDLNLRRALFAAQVTAQDHAAALSNAEVIEKLAPQLALGPFLSGQVRAAAGQNTEAMVDFERALKLEPKALDPLVALVRLEVSAKQLNAAAARVEAALVATPDAAQFHEMRALIRIEQRQLPEAFKSLAEAQRLAPTWWEPYRTEAMAHFAGGHDDLAFSAYRNGIAKASDKGPLIDELATVYERKGRPNESIKVYEEVVAANPGNIAAVNNLALLLANHGSTDADVRRAVDLVGRLATADNPAYLDTRGWVLLKAGRAQEALPLLQKAAEGSGVGAVVLYHLAVAQVQTGDADAARRNLEKALQSGRNFAGRDEAKRQLAQLDQAVSANRPG